MSNLMSLVKLRNKTSRNGFDLSSKRNFSAKCGEVLPCFFKPVLPGDTFNISFKSFTRTLPLNTAAFARMREYIDVYFIPAETLWNKYKHVLTQMYDNLQHANGPLLKDNVVMSGDLPYVTCEQIARYITSLVEDEDVTVNKTLFGFSRAAETVKLLSYLGYPDFSYYLTKGQTWDSKPMVFNEPLSVMPLFCYQKAYADFIRYSQWEKTNPSTFNCDYINGSDDCNLDLTNLKEDYNFFDMRYANYNKDLYFGVLPRAQYGETSAIPISVNSISIDGNNTTSTPLHSLFFGDNGNVYGQQNQVSSPGATKNISLISSMSVLAIRQYENLQRWKEITQSVDQDYAQQIEAHWNVKVSEFLSDEARYLGGLAQSLDINPITNNNLSDGGTTDIKGTATFSQNGSINFTSKGEYGFIIALYHVKPIFDYCCGQSDPMVYLTNALDYPIPELDNIGMEQVPVSRLINYPAASMDAYAMNLKNNPFMGYAPRYVNWKTDIDKALGAFTTDSRRPWIVPLTPEIIKDSLYPTSGSPLDKELDESSVPQASNFGYLNWTFFKINPRVLDPIFVSQCDDTYDTDQFLISSFVDCKVVRNLDVNGLPY